MIIVIKLAFHPALVPGNSKYLLIRSLVRLRTLKSVLSFTLITFLHPIQIYFLQIEFFGEKCALLFRLAI